MKLVPLIANANNRLDKFLPKIEETAHMAEKYAVSALNIKEKINLLVSDAFPDQIIPETHIGGHAYLSDFASIAIDTSVEALDSDSLFQQICHELCHVVRWQYNDEHIKTLLDGMISEGLATAFQIKSVGDNDLKLDFFAQTIAERDDAENEKILNTLHNYLSDERYDYHKIFFSGDPALGLPRWSGYSLGYFAVKKYMEKTEKDICEIFTEKYSELEKYILEDNE